MFSIFLTQYDGWFLGPIAKVLGYILNAIYNLFSSIGIENIALCIIVFTVLINVLMIPSNLKQQKFSKLSNLITPEMKKIEEKYKGKRDEASLRKKQAETQALYDKYGISPTSGCLPMLITFPILFAMYRVMYSIPAYIDSVYVLYEQIAQGIQATPGYYSIMAQYAQDLKVIIKGIDFKEVTSLEINHIIDILAKFTSTQWTALTEQFPAIAATITANSAEIMKINSFVFGMNIVQAPGFTFPGILIPIFAMASQWYQQKSMMSNSVKGENPTMDSMNSMMKFMPIFSGVICITLPIGIGIYWITGSVFRIIQQMIMNRHMDKLDVEDLINENVAKAEKKRARKGASGAKIEEYSNQRTSSIKEIARNQTASSSRPSASASEKKEKKADSSNHAAPKTTEKSAGGISGYAHLLDHRDKGDK